MSEPESWMERRLAAAFAAAKARDHSFPDAVATELYKMLAGPLQEARKPAELDAIAIALIAANRGDT